DVLMLLVSIVAAYFIRFGILLDKLARIPVDKILIYFLLLLPQVIIVFYVSGIYERWGQGNINRIAIKMLFALAFVGMLNGLLFYFYQTIYIGRFVFTIQLTVFFMLGATAKLLYINQLRKKETIATLVMVNLSEREKKLLQSEKGITETYQFIDFKFTEKADLLKFVKILDKKTIIIISSTSKIVDRNIDVFISLKFNKFFVYNMNTFYIRATGKIPKSSFGEVWTLISENEFVMGISSYYRVKRLMDFTLSIIVLILCLPILMLLPIIIKAGSRGPVFFIQERLGWNKKPFKLIKFRTMKTDAEDGTGPVWAVDNDPRITRVGKIMRKTRLDEIPQLINVLKGEMSFVGNRPIREHFADVLAQQIPYYDLRFIIKPGLTGWSQVKYDYAGTVEGQIEKFKYELFYIKNMSLILDIVILIKTIKTIFGLDGK
ncbi:MAG: exopolysaccharide biosynthesis polyprenyl glycosylphosphotransferase, partial [bacterium]|nr:exopolysaccharide biosynthesis polyprenyl glycosylphosphotransferase [bacterium]